MRIGPDRRLVRAAAAWTGAALLVVLWPPLWAVSVAALALLGGLVAWDAVLLGRQRPLAAARRLPARAFVGRGAALSIELRNAGAAPVEVDVLDELPSDLAPEERRFTGVVVPPGGAVVLEHAVCPRVRGDRPLGPVITLERSPLGWLCRCGTAAGGTLRVYPDTSSFLRPEALDPRRVLAALGVRPARRRGEGMEFESLRDYVPGDDPRRVDWAATARRGRLVTRLYQHERRHTVLVALDASRLMGARVEGRTKLDHAVDGALALVYAALIAGDRVGLLVFDREVRGHVTPRTHRRHLGPFIELLRTVEPRGVEADFRALVRDVTLRERQRALLVVLTDFVEADPAALIEPLVLLARRHRVLVVALRDQAYRALAPDAPAAGDDPLALYRRLVLDELLRERETALTRLRRQGIQTLDLVPEAMTAAVLNRYLALRHAGDR